MNKLKRSFAPHPARCGTNSYDPDGGLGIYPQFLVDISFRQRVEAVIRNLNLKGYEKVLDCGCGDGIFGSILKEKCEQIIGLDNCLNNLKMSKRSNRGYVSLVLGDVQNLPFKPGQFDRVLCTEVLEHLQNDVQALAEINRVLINDALFVLTVPNLNYPFLWDPLNKILTNVLHVSPIKKGIFGGMWFAHERLYSKAELEKKFDAADFGVRELEGLTHIFLPYHPLIWNFYAILNYVLKKYKFKLNVLLPPKLFSLVVECLDYINLGMKKIDGSVNILVFASPRNL
jgi:ubiquinone/menaquinone biosynthesis C-methylase UbiE